jgi:hypothetical protein
MVAPSAATIAATSASAPAPPDVPSPAALEETMMSRLRASDPAAVLRLAREIAHKYPNGSSADERDSRVVDALLAMGQLQEAHYRAQLFVQHHPDSPFARHVMNLMGVHPRPPGVVPEPPDNDNEP